MKICLTVAIVLLSIASYEACIYYGWGVSPADKQLIIDDHNYCRLLVARGLVPSQPRAINLLRVYWDDALANAAQNIANSCVFGHQTVTDSRWFAVGQNIYMSIHSVAPGNTANWTEAIAAWFNEYKIYRYPGGFSAATGHYTQVVWADTRYVGCGFTYYKPDQSDPQYYKLYVCNYGPAGNFNNQPPYQTGVSGCDNLC